MYGDILSETNKMIGKVIKSVSRNREQDEITFSFNDGTDIVFGVEGDCCSHSWVEHLETPNDVIGATITGIDDSDQVTSDHPEHDGEDPECISVYNTVFHTNRGDIILEYRNSSNGYYGGYLTIIKSNL